MNILILDENHPILVEELTKAGHQLTIAYTMSEREIHLLLPQVDGIIVRSRFAIDRRWIDKAKNLKFIARVGAGVENIDTEYAKSKQISILSSPEGNAQAVAEHSLALLLNLLNNIVQANQQVNQNRWLREENRGIELSGKTVGILGYGHMGKAFARVLAGFNINIIAYDIEPSAYDDRVTGVSTLAELLSLSDIISLHLPYDKSTHYMVDDYFINNCKKKLFILNTSRGKIIDTKALHRGLKSGKIAGAGLDVIEYEKQDLSDLNQHDNEILAYLKQSPHVIVTPHVAGWTMESHKKLSQVIANKIQRLEQENLNAK